MISTSLASLPFLASSSFFSFPGMRGHEITRLISNALTQHFSETFYFWIIKFETIASVISYQNFPFTPCQWGFVIWMNLWHVCQSLHVTIIYHQQPKIKTLLWNYDNKTSNERWEIVEKYTLNACGIVEMYLDSLSISAK